MKISTKGRYGLTIMLELTRQYGDGPTSLKTIAREKELSEHYLEQLASPLKRAGLVNSVRGAYGGYVLARDPRDIKAGDVIRALEGPISPVEGIKEEEPAKRALWIRIRDAVKDVLDTTTLEDLRRHDYDQHQHTYMFYI